MHVVYNKYFLIGVCPGPFSHAFSRHAPRARDPETRAARYIYTTTTRIPFTARRFSATGSQRHTASARGGPATAPRIDITRFQRCATDRPGGPFTAI